MSMREKVLKLSLKREEGWLYYVDKKGNVARKPMMRGFGSYDRSSSEVLNKAEIHREQGWLYYVDEDGDVARVQMVGAATAARVDDEQPVAHKPTSEVKRAGASSSKAKSHAKASSKTKSRFATSKTKPSAKKKTKAKKR